MPCLAGLDFFQVLAVLADAYREHAPKDFLNHMQCLIAVENATAIEALLSDLLTTDVSSSARNREREKEKKAWTTPHTHTHTYALNPSLVCCSA